MKGELVTEAEAKDAGLPRLLMQEWADIMQGLWTYSIEVFKKTGMWRPTQGENEISLSGGYVVRALLVNSKWIEVQLYHGETELATIRYTGKMTPLSVSIWTILQYHKI